jgi:hypothetical protein
MENLNTKNKESWQVCNYMYIKRESPILYFVSNKRVYKSSFCHFVRHDNFEMTNIHKIFEVNNQKKKKKKKIRQMIIFLFLPDGVNYDRKFFFLFVICFSKSGKILSPIPSFQKIDFWGWHTL